MNSEQMATSDSSRSLIKIGSRKSKLALIQTELVIEQLRLHHGDKFDYEIVSMTTTGDHILDIPLSKIGEKSLFTRELENELLNGNIDFVVHSLKDLPTQLPDGCSIAVILKREEPNDVIVLKEGLKCDDAIDVIKSKKLSNELSIGTSSLRRIAQLKHMNPSINISDVRGNLNTRLMKLDKSDSCYSALILASAGLKRLGYQSRISHVLTSPNWFYAVGQGALAVECKTNDNFIINLLSPLCDGKTTFECLAERTFLQRLEGGCSIPIGVQCYWNEENEDILNLNGIILSLDGTKKIQHKGSIDLNDDSSTNSLPLNYTGIVVRDDLSFKQRKAFINCVKLGFDLAETLLNHGAQEILNSLKIVDSK